MNAFDKVIVQSQLFSPEDELTEIIRKYEDTDELLEEDLFQVSAARKPDFAKFRDYCRKKQ